MNKVIETYPSGKKKVVALTGSDRLNGHFQMFYEEGTMRSEYHMLDGRIHEEARTWHKNGKPKSQVSYAHGKPDGLILEWYEDGNLAFLTEMKDGEKHGSCVKHHPNGSLAIVGKFSKGKQHGVWLHFSEEGDVSIEHQWIDGEFVPTPIKNQSLQQDPISCGDTSPGEVCFQKSGKTFPWDGKHKNILELAEENGIPIPACCWAGTDGVCLTRILSGKIFYPDFHTGYWETEADECLPCVGIPKGRLVLDA